MPNGMYGGVRGERKSPLLDCSDKAYEELHNDILAVAITVVDILNGASYLFDKEPPSVSEDFKDKNVAELHGNKNL
ncbi:MAG: hypothetical protein NC412_13880 [Roseburia sp.]|nr:hypothetical protein [Roseburia sp.]MCM1278326.1 hypothetical protein [Robinsoniella sp.]